jgi:ABC-type phosphonate transport system ATPase subunit
MTGRLEIDGVSKRYGDVLALQEMTFEVRAGELFGFVGSNGAGKTTTMRIVLGCWPPIGARSGGMAGRSTSKTGGASGTCRVDAPEAPRGWAEGLPGVTVHTQDGTRAVLELSAGADDQVVLKTALSTGPVREFARRRPSLVDLFRSVVSEETTR